MKAKITYNNGSKEKIKILDYQINDNYFHFIDIEGNEIFIFNTNIRSINIFDKDVDERK